MRSISTIPTVIETEELLESSRGVCEYDDWIDHCLCVGRAAGTIARALAKNGHEIDAEKATVMGYLHDIGKLVGPYQDHPLNGYHYLHEQGCVEEYCAVCLTHSFIDGDTEHSLGPQEDMKPDPELIRLVRAHEYTIYDRLICLCDHLCLLRVMTLDQRLVDVLIRHGIGSGAREHLIAAHKLKADFDEMLGCNLYDLFPEMKEEL